jgi:DNA repair ATPase RecN
MKLVRLEVEGGFLDGLDLRFADGLNVLIGARGSGKTSVVEVLRYCLNQRAVTADAQKKAETQALWVLDGGCATLTVEVDGVERVIRRCAGQDAEERLPDTSGLLFISQKEIEAIGRDADSRRRILDDLAKRGEHLEFDHGEIAGVARKVVAEQQELDDVVEALGALDVVPDQLKEAEAEQAEGGEPEQDELSDLQEAAKEVSREVGDLAETVDAYETVRERLQSWRDTIEASRTEEPDWSRAPKEFADSMEPKLIALRTSLVKAMGELEDLAQAAAEREHKADIELGVRRRKLAELSSKIESIEEGAGKVARRIAALREQDERRRTLIERRARLEERIAELRHDRSVVLDRVGEAADERFRVRSEAAEGINERFGGEIQIDVVKAGEVGEYEAALGRALEGSGLQWRTLAKQLADRMSPRELITDVERLDVEAIAQAAAISDSRAQRLVGHLAGVDASEILMADIDEEVDFSLLDGKELKSTSRLSLGQRCTVVLPLLLARDPDLAVLDQPEDHLDNAFIVDTVVDALRGRRPDSQALIATHNANIPVLGDADLVVHLSSSGTRAFVVDAEPLEAPAIVSAITRLMEGGEAAFKRRADFYSA